MNTLRPTFLPLLLLAAALVTLVADWQQGYAYKPFSRYLVDEAHWAQAKWNEWRAQP